MNRLRSLILFGLLVCSDVNADLFGGDLVLLTQILSNSILQLGKLKDILGTAKENADLIRQINQGINDSLHLIRQINPNIDPGIYSDWTSSTDALKRLLEIYGQVSNSPESRIQKDTDQNIAEAISANNSYYKYAKDLDGVAEQIKDSSHHVSPSGAQKMTAQALGVVIQALNQNLRAQSSMLKMQAQQMALNNYKEKSKTKEHQERTSDLVKQMKGTKHTFMVPRFK